MNKNNDTGGMGIFGKKYEIIRKPARELVESEITPMTTQIDETGEYPEKLRGKIIDCGFHAVVIPEEYGECGGDTVSVTIVTEEFMKADASTSIQLMPNSLSDGSLMMFDNEVQKQKYPCGVAEGKLIGASAITEPEAGSDMVAITATAETDGSYYILNGCKCFVTNGPRCDFVAVFARTDINARGVRGINVFIVESAWERFSRGTMEDKMSMYGFPTYDLIFEDVHMPKENLLASEGQGFKICMATLGSGRITVATQGFGIAQGALGKAVKYVKERVQFGKPISELQNIQLETADMVARVERGRQLARHAAELRDAGKPYSKSAAMAGYYRDDLCDNIAYRSLQLHGGYGYTKDYPIERMFRDTGFVAIYEGTSEIQRMAIANHILGK